MMQPRRSRCCTDATRITPHSQYWYYTPFTEQSRRSFRSCIRMGVHQFVLFHRCRELALEALASCEHERMMDWKRRRERQLASLGNEEIDPSLYLSLPEEVRSSWKYSCSNEQFLHCSFSIIGMIFKLCNGGN